MARPSSPRAERPGSAAPSAKPASSSSGAAKGTKPKARKPKAPPRPNADSFESKARVDVPITNVAELGVDDARSQLAELQKKYGALIVNFNNQQAELTQARREVDRLKSAQASGPVLAGDAGAIQEQLQSTLAVSRAAAPHAAPALFRGGCPEPAQGRLRAWGGWAGSSTSSGPAHTMMRPTRAPGLPCAALGAPLPHRCSPPRRSRPARAQDLRAEEEKNMALQKKINKLQVEHVSEEEVDQLFYALELKEQQLAQAQRDKAGLEQEVQTARQLTARGTNLAEPKYIEIHHQHNLSDDSDDADSDDE